MEKLTKECVLQSAARLEQESQDAVMRDIPQFFEAEIVTRFAGAVPQKKELNPLVFNMERGICLAETVDFLRECPALRPYDLILANELDSGCARSGERDTAAEIARALGMQYVFGLEFVELKDAAHGFHGNAIFSRWPILWAEVLRLPEQYNWYYDRQKRIGGRNAVFAKLDVQGQEVGAVSIHLENRTSGAGRLQQMKAVLQEVERVFPGIPVVLGGDLNTNTFDGRDKAVIRHLCDEPEELAAAIEMIDLYEPLLQDCTAAGYAWRAASGGADCTRRKPLPEGGCLHMKLDWLLPRGLYRALQQCDFYTDGRLRLCCAGQCAGPVYTAGAERSQCGSCLPCTAAEGGVNVINTILFDMGGTLEDIWYNDQTIHSVTGELRTFLNEHDLGTGCNDITFWNKLNSGIRTYKQWSESNELEKKPEEIWPEYYMADFNLDREKLQEVAERLAGMWEVTYYHRELRPKVKETLEELKKRGYHLGVISNTASLYSVFDVLEQYGIRDYFEDVTLSSVTGYRKPHPSIFQISLRQMQAKPEECAYVGDTISRDIIGAKRMHFGAAIQIQSFLSAQKDAGVDAAYQPDHIIRELPELVDYLEERNRAERLTMQ